MTDTYFNTNKASSHLDFVSLWDSDELAGSEPPTPQPSSKRASPLPDSQAMRGKRRRLCEDDECWEPYKEEGKPGPVPFPEIAGVPWQVPSFSSCTFFNVASALSTSILQICTSANRGILKIKKEDRCRLQFLNETIDLIVSYSSNQRAEVKALPPFQDLFRLVTSRMIDVLRMLERIERLESTITENFDIFELKLRGYLEELKALFPLRGAPPPPLSLITNNSSRFAWARCFGENVSFVSFDKFVEMLEIEGIFIRGSELYGRAILYLRYFVSFPHDDVITTFKWNQLTRLFGPFDNFANNFQQTVTGKGFLGLINRIQAYEILTMAHRPCSLLIRASRTEPQFLAFSYKDKDGKIAHRLNKDRHGQLVPVEEFIRSKFPGYELVNKRLNLEKILGVEKFPDPLSHYASETDGYYF